jgi:hypothetical protein
MHFVCANESKSGTFFQKDFAVKHSLKSRNDPQYIYYKMFVELTINATGCSGPGCDRRLNVMPS